MLSFLSGSRIDQAAVSRRSFLTAGSLLMGGLTLPKLLAAEAAQRTRSDRALIMVYLSGGLAHQDSFDLKPQAPAEIRGEFSPIDTNVAGIKIGEHLPRLATLMDRCAVLRSIVGMRDEHSSFHTLTGYPMSEAQRDGKPHMGSVISRVLGPINPVVPDFVDLFPTMQHRPYNSPGPGILGPTFAPVTADGEAVASMKPRFFTLDQLSHRRRLLDAFDGFRRETEEYGIARMDHAYQQAYDVLTSSQIVNAIDLEQEDPAVRDRYGRGSSKHQGDGAPLWNDQLLMARRLVEAGVRCVTVAYGFWDTHGGNFRHLKENLPKFDQGISALVEDLSTRGLADRVTLIVWGEFGRTPKINKDAGRDHWAPVNSALLAGAGIRTGQVIGSTDAQGAYAQDRPIHFHDVLATLYDRLGIDCHQQVRNLNDRPFALLSSDARPIRELA